MNGGLTAGGSGSIPRIHQIMPRHPENTQTGSGASQQQAPPPQQQQGNRFYQSENSAAAQRSNVSPAIQRGMPPKPTFQSSQRPPSMGDASGNGYSGDKGRARIPMHKPPSVYTGQQGAGGEMNMNRNSGVFASSSGQPSVVVDSNPQTAKVSDLGLQVRVEQPSNSVRVRATPMAPSKRASTDGTTNEGGFTSMNRDKQLFYNSYFGPTALYKYLNLRNMGNPVFLPRNLQYRAKQKRNGVGFKRKLVADDLVRMKQCARISGLDSYDVFTRKSTKMLRLTFTSLQISPAIPYLFPHDVGKTDLLKAVIAVRLDGEIKFSQPCSIPVNIQQGEVVLPRSFSVTLEVNWFLLQRSLGEWNVNIEFLKTRSSRFSQRSDSSPTTALSGSLIIAAVANSQLFFDTLAVHQVEFVSNPNQPSVVGIGSIEKHWVYEFDSLDNNSDAEMKDMTTPSTRSMVEQESPVNFVLYYDQNRRCLREKKSVPLCTWCGIHCKSLRSLVYHLQCSHDKFRFGLRSGEISEIEVFPRLSLSSDLSRSTLDDLRMLVTSTSAYLSSFAFFSAKHNIGRSWYEKNLVRHIHNLPEDAETANYKKFERRKNSRVNRRKRRNHVKVATELKEKLYYSDEDSDAESASKRHRIGRPPKAKVSSESLEVSRGKPDYFHSSVFSTITPEEGSADSDKEVDESWRLEQGLKMIEEFDDVTYSEKEMIKLWNRFVFKHPINADSRVAQAILKFVEVFGEEILSNNLRNATLLHFLNLWEFGLLEMKDIEKAMSRLDGRSEASGSFSI
jgi:hypothetical protein